MSRKVSRRELLKAASGSTVGMAMGVDLPKWGLKVDNPFNAPEQAHPAGKNKVPWFKRTLVGMEVGPSDTNPLHPAADPTFYSRVNGKTIVQNLLKARVEYAVIFMKDWNFAYYDSRIVRKCPSLGQRDLLREVLDEAGKYSLPIIAYVVIQGDTAAWLAHPEWRMEDWEGNSIRPRLCFNSAYLEYNKRVAAELMQYEIVGFHFDMLDFGFGPPIGCFCNRYCQPLFRRKYGMEMPLLAKPTWDEDWDKILAFREYSNAHFAHELADFVHSKRSDVSVDFNYHGYPPFSWVEGELPVKHALDGDFVTAEGLPWVFGYNNVSLLPLFLFGARLGGPVQVASSRSMYNYYDPTVRPVNDMKWEVATYQAHGAQVTIVDKINYDGTQDPVVYERLGEVFSSAREKREYFGHKPLHEVGVYYSARSRDWFGREDTLRYARAFYGAHKALAQSHITMGMVMEGNISIERLREFATLYLPNTTILTKEEVDLIHQYVFSGGNLLVTGSSGIYDYYGRLQNNSVLEEIIGAEFRRAIESENDNFIRFPATLHHGAEAPLVKDIPSDWSMPVWGPITVYKPTTAKPVGEVLQRFRPATNSPWARHLSADKVVGPAIFINRYGKGKVIYTACSPDAAWVSDYRMLEHRYLLHNLLRYLNPKPLVSVNAPANVEIMVSSDKRENRLFVRLVTFSSPATSVATRVGNGRRALPPPMEEPMYYKATVELGCKFSKVLTASGKTQLSRNGNQVQVNTSEIDEVLIFWL